MIKRLKDLKNSRVRKSKTIRKVRFKLSGLQFYFMCFRADFKTFLVVHWRDLVILAIVAFYSLTGYSYYEESLSKFREMEFSRIADISIWLSRIFLIIGLYFALKNLLMVKERLETRDIKLLTLLTIILTPFILYLYYQVEYKTFDPDLNLWKIAHKVCAVVILSGYLAALLFTMFLDFTFEVVLKK